MVYNVVETIKKIRTEGVEEEIERGVQSVVGHMLAQGLDVETVSKFTVLNIKQIEAIKEGMKGKMY